MLNSLLISQAEQVLNACKKHQMKLALAESCTGGLASAYITSIPGSSLIFDRGFVTYSNKAKQELLGVSKKLLEEEGAVSAAVAEAMAKGAIDFSEANLAVSATGIAGPGGGTNRKPVGLIFIGLASKNHILSHKKFQLEGLRYSIREQTVSHIFNWILEEISVGQIVVPS